MRLSALMLDDDQAEMYGSVLDLAEITVVPAVRDDDARMHVRDAASRGAGFDVITTDLHHPGGNGIEFLRWVRNLPDEMVFHRILRARHTPAVVISACLSDNAREAIKQIDSLVPVVPKPSAMKEIYVAIESAISEYRHRMMAELDCVGVAITYEGGRYRIAEAYAPRSETLDTTYLFGPAQLISPACGRLLLALDRSTFAERGIEEFEWLLNKPNTTEREFHRFFLRHPEFLLAGEHAWYWSEPALTSATRGNVIRPDFMLQPGALARAPWRWTAVDLKSPTAKLMRSARFHADFSRDVQRVITQLRDYAEFFADPANEAALKKRFGGVAPRPGLMAIIGRTPKHDEERFSTLVRRTPDVQITTYDEVLEFRREQMLRLRQLIDRE